MVLSLGELASYLDAEIHGDPEGKVRSISSLADANSDQVSFLASAKYLEQLKQTSAGAVILPAAVADQAPCSTLVVPDPYLAFARVTQLFDNRPKVVSVHPSAVVDPDATLGEGVSVAANAVIGKGACVGSHCEIGAGVVIGERASLGEACVIYPNVTIYHDVELGARVRVHSGSVLGSDGFGFAPHSGGWERIAQIGTLVIGDDVSIGSNTSIDRGALDNTVIADGVIIDNLVHMAHNVEIGTNSAIAGCVGIAGSTKIGSGCTMAGGVAVAGHLTICDGVHMTGMAMITNSIDVSGSYSSGTSFMPTSQWRRSVGRFKQLDSIAKRLQKLEKTQEGKA